MISLLISLIVLGVVWYLVKMLPMDGRIARIVDIIFVVIAIFIVLGAFGIGPGIGLGRINM